MKEMIKSGKTLLNALAFANVGNLSEFESLMNAIDHQPEPVNAGNKTKPTLAAAIGATHHYCEPAL